MTLLPIGLGTLVLFLAGYLLYARWIARYFALDPARRTPAHEQGDGVDFVPAKAPVLLAQHFSAISAAGPIAGPIMAGWYFGWGPAVIWILAGCVFIGAAHDFAALVASVRHRARSVAEVLRERIGTRAGTTYLAFVWISLVYVTVAFTDLTASEFVKAEHGGAVASSSAMYLGLAVALGFVMNRLRIPLVPLTVVSVGLLLAVIGLGREFPVSLPASLEHPRKAWDVLILLYCFVAALIPMGLLLQPRGYLGGYLLYAFLGAGVVGLLFGGVPVQWPAFRASVNNQGQPILPFLFVTIACGACSGFHGLVCSGTTSKQLDREPDAKAVGYGAMLLEGVIAVISLACVMMLSTEGQSGKPDTDMVFAGGIARFLEVLHVPREFGISFGLLALATFVYDTLDVGTRLGRYILQELTGLQGRSGAVIATALTLAPAAAFLLTTKEDAYQAVWPAFGTSNQLLAALTLMAVSVWLRAEGRASWFTAVPAVFLLGMTGWSLAWTVVHFEANRLIGTLSVVLLLLALSVTVDCARAYFRPNPRTVGA